MSPSATSPRAIALLCLAPSLLALLVIVAPITTDPVALFGGLPYDLKPSWLGGFSTIDPNQGYTSYALGVRAALDLLAGRAPLWNPYEGLGSPLLGEMQAAALFPPTLLLLLPFGQVVEHAALQIVAGLGTYLFLRRFGLGVTAALLGGLLFEFNGVFAWLRNAIYNPVAFLPWLFYAVETLWIAAADGRTLRNRYPTIALGAIAAALAVYAGFPEVVYFYCLPLVGWIVLRSVALPWRRALSFLGDLLLLGIAALLLAAPVLLAFAHFLAEGHVGEHQNAGFKDAVLDPGSLVMYLLPYLYGPISFSLIPGVARFWGNGGYLGLLPCALAIGGWLTGWRRPTTWWLGLWTVFAIAVSHGAPVLLDVFRRVPLVTIAAFARYIDTGWIFCAVTLAAMFVDRIPTLHPAQRRRLGTSALLLTLLLLTASVALTWSTLHLAWQPHGGQRGYIIATAAAAIALVACMMACIWRRAGPSAQPLLVALAAAEAITLFAVPYASSPAGTKLDLELVTFLQDHLGLQRVAIASGIGVSPNFGSAFGIATINYDDLPVPDRTAAFVRRDLDPNAVPIMFRPTVGIRPETPAERRDSVIRHLPNYASAGVRYMLANGDLFIAPLYDLETAGLRAVPLASGQSVTLTSPSSPVGMTTIGVSIGTYGGSSDGRLVAELCRGDRCQTGSADLATAADNATLHFALSPPLVPSTAAYRLTLTKQGGTHPVALWSKPPTATEAARADGVPDIAGLLPVVTTPLTAAPRAVLHTPTTTVFELAGTRDYASAPGCRIDVQTHERLNADCAHPARLTRLEVFMRGWTAQVNGAAAPVFPIEDTFQAIDLPAGRSVVAFSYDPAGVRPALWIALLTLAALVATIGLSLLPSRQSGHPLR